MRPALQTLQKIISEISGCVLFCALVLILCGCGEEKSIYNPYTSGITQVEKLNQRGCKIGLPQGTAAMNVGERIFDRAEVLYFNSLPDAYLAVQQKKIDAFLFDRHSMVHVVQNNPSLKLLPKDVAEEHIVIGFPKRHAELCAKVNAFIHQYRADGTYIEMYQRWCESIIPQAAPYIPPPPNPKVKYRVGTEGLNEPMSYYGKDNQLTGFDIELIRRLALFLNAEIEVVAMTYDALIPAAESGRIDMLISSLNKTVERQEKMVMSDDYINSGIAVMVHADYTEEDSTPVKGIYGLKDLQGKKVASLTGSTFRDLTAPLQPGINHVLYNDNPTAIHALRNGKVDAILMDRPIAELNVARFPKELRFVCTYTTDQYAFAVQKGSPLNEPVSGVVRMLKESGEMYQFAKKWYRGADSEKVLCTWTHKPDYTGKNGVLRYASDYILSPMCYCDSMGRPTGLDIEIMRRVAYELDLKFEFTAMSFGSLIEALVMGRVDAIGGGMSVTEERKKRIEFTEPYYDGGISIVARKDAKSNAQAFTSIDDLDGYRIGIVTGSASDTILRTHLPNAMPFYFESLNALCTALDVDKIDAFLMEEAQAKIVLKQRSDFKQLPDVVRSDEYAFIFPYANVKLREAFSKEIRAMKADGTLKEITRKWFTHQNPPPPPLPDVRPNPPKGMLKCAVVPEYEPFIFRDNHKITGFDLDVAMTIAERLGYGIEPVEMRWPDYLNAVEKGTVAMGIGCTSVTEERKSRVCFAEPNYKGSMVMIVKSQTPMSPAKVVSQVKSMGSEINTSFERTFIKDDRWKLILQGLEITVLITLFSTFFGTLLAFPVCFMRTAQKRVWRWLGKAYVIVMQGTPVLVVLMTLYYVIFASVDIDAVIVAIIGFALSFSAYAGEMLCSGIRAIPKGQTEAALALGFTPRKAFWKVVMPQVLRQILPIYRGEFINVLKSTSIVGYIAIQDLTKMSDIIRSRTYEAFFPLITTALIYFAVSWLLAGILSLIERKLDTQSRAKQKTGQPT